MIPKCWTAENLKSKHFSSVCLFCVDNFFSHHKIELHVLGYYPVLLGVNVSFQKTNHGTLTWFESGPFDSELGVLPLDHPALA